MKVKTISVVGAGKLGLCIACVLAEYYKVICIDTKEDYIKELSKGVLNSTERDLSRWFKLYHSNITFTSETEDYGDITFIVVPTPSDMDGNFTSYYVERVMDNIPAKQIVVIISTIMPEETNRLQKQYPNLHIIYSPTFIALGSIIDNFINPDFILVGIDHNHGITKLKSIYHTICYKPVFCELSSLEAEIAKLALNCYLTTKITFANQLGNLCYRLGIPADRICKTIGMDRRVGRTYFRSGLGYGGCCFPRDNQALSFYFGKKGIHPKLFQVVDELNDKQVEEFITRIEDKKPRNVALKSLSFKEGTDNDECSQLRIIYQKLLMLGYDVRIGMDNADVVVDWWEVKKKDE